MISLESRRWARADNYIGRDLSKYYVVISHHRDSEPLEEANYRAALEILGDLPGIEIHKFDHWAVGWVEAIMMHENAPLTTREQVEEILERLEEYPVLDDDLTYHLEREHAQAIWDCLDLQDRIRAIRRARKLGERISIFAARHDKCPVDYSVLG